MEYILVKTVADYTIIFSLSANLHLFKAILILGKRKKSAGVISGEYGACGVSGMFLVLSQIFLTNF